MDLKVFFQQFTHQQQMLRVIINKSQKDRKISFSCNYGVMYLYTCFSFTILNNNSIIYSANRYQPLPPKATAPTWILASPKETRVQSLPPFIDDKSIIITRSLQIFYSIAEFKTMYSILYKVNKWLQNQMVIARWVTRQYA